MGTIKDRNGMDLTEAEGIKKRWQEYTEELHKKDLHDPDNHDGVITQLEPDMLEYEVKWALESITTNKASGGDGIPVEDSQEFSPTPQFKSINSSALSFPHSPTLTSIHAAAAKSLQSCPTLCDPIDMSPPGSSVPVILQARTLEWVAISFSNAGK